MLPLRRAWVTLPSVTIATDTTLTRIWRSTWPSAPSKSSSSAFPGNQFSGEIIPELERLVDNDTISIIDGILVRKDADGEITFIEFEEMGGNPDADRTRQRHEPARLAHLRRGCHGTRRGLEPNSSEAILVFEHTWAKPLRDAIINSGGVLANDFRVPGLVVEELLAELAELGDES